MKIRRNQVFLTLILVVLIGWLFYTKKISTYNVEAKDALIELVKNNDFDVEDIDDVLAVKLINDYTGDAKIVNKTMDLIYEGDKEKILDHLKKI